MSAIFWFEKETAKKHLFFIFFKGCHLLMGSSIDMNVDVFWEASAGFPKAWFYNFSRNIAKVMSTWMSKVGQNSTAFKN